MLQYHMGYFIELNTLLRLPKESIQPNELIVGKKFTVIKDKERIFPLHIALLLVTDDWTFVGYCVTHTTLVANKQTTLTFEVISLFTPEERNTYTKRFLEAAKITGEIK